jgi:hypothetical protein
MYGSWSNVLTARAAASRYGSMPLITELMNACFMSAKRVLASRPVY